VRESQCLIKAARHSTFRGIKQIEKTELDSILGCSNIPCLAARDTVRKERLGNVSLVRF